MKNNFFKNSYSMIKNYRWDSLFFQYWKKLMLFFMIPFIIICGLIFIYFNNNYKTEIDASLKKSFTKTENTLTKTFEEIDKNYMLFSSDENVKMYVTLSNENLHTYQNYNLFYQTNKLLYNCINTSSYLDSIYLFNNKSKYVFSTRFSDNLSTFSDKIWYDEYQKTGKTNFIIPAYDSFNKHMNLSVCYGFYFNYATLDGMVIFNIDADYLKNILLSDSPDTSENIYLINKSGLIVFSTNIQEIGTYVKEDYSSIYETKDIKMHRTKETITLAAPFKNLDLLLVSKNSSSFYNKRMTVSNIMLIILVSLISLIAPLLISLYLSSKFYTSIAEIVSQLQKVYGPEYIEDKNFDEVKFINRNIISLINNNKNIEKELVEKVTALKKSQAIALQTQLNPHFLFNTLNAISMIYSNLIKERNDAEILIKLLSDLLYFSLNTKEYIIDVKDEILYTKKYIDIERIKYENSFDTEWLIDDEIYNLKTIKFILQPIVENAFEHGIKYLTKRRGKLTISAKVENNELRFTVVDNGNGISYDKLNELNNRLESDDMPENKHIGICNVNRRIQLIFGDAYGVNIESNNNGTTVEITMPLIN